MSNPNTNNNLQTQTSNALHNAIMEAGDKDRPPMLAPGNYNPPYKFKWNERSVPVAKGSSKTTIEGFMESYKAVSDKIRIQLDAKAEAVQIILTWIDNNIYSTIDACPNACEMWKAIERLKQDESINVQDLETNLYWEFGKFTSRDGESLELYYSRFYKMMNELVRNKCDVTNHQVNVQFLLQLQPEWQRFVTLVKQSQELKTVSYHKLYDILKQHQNKVNELRAERLARNANPLALVAQQQPVYHPQNHPTHYTHNSSSIPQQTATRNRGKANDQEPIMVAEDDEMLKEKEIDKLMALISLSFKKIYKPTNNNLRTSSNTSRANQDNTPRTNRGNGYDNQRAVNVVGARENVGTQDAAYHKEKTLLCKQDEAGFKLSADQANWRDDTNDELEDQELETHYLYMAQIQEVSPDVAENFGPIFDDELLQKVDHDDDDLARERNLLASLIAKLKCEINDSKNRNKFLESSNKTLVDKLKREIEDFKTINKSLESSNNHFKEANTKLAKTNQLMFKDIKKFQDELDRYHDVNYASKVELDCAKAKGELISYKMSSEKSLNEYTRKLNDLNQTISDMKQELVAHQEKISIMSQEKEPQKKFYKTREDKEIEKVIALENKVKVLDDIVYKTGQSIQTMNMLNRNCKTSFVKPEFLKKAQRANPRLYDIGCYNDNLSLMLAPESDESIRLAQESRSKLSDLIKPFDYQQLNNLYDLFVPKREKSVEQRFFSERSKISHKLVKNETSKESFNKQTTSLEIRMDESIPWDKKCKSSKELLKIKSSIDMIFDGVEHCKQTIAKRTYFGNIDPFIQNTIEGNFSPQISAILANFEKFHSCLKEEMVDDLRYFNSLELETKLDEFTNLKCDYLEQVEKCERLEQELSKRSENVNNKSFNELSKRFSALEQHSINLELALQQNLKAQIQDKNIAISELKKLIEKVKGKSVETKFKKSSVIRQPNAFKSQRHSILGKPAAFLDKERFFKTSHCTDFASIGVIATSVSRPQLKSNQLEDRVLHNNSEMKTKEVEEHRRNFKFSKNKMSVTACNDGLNVKTSNVNFVCVTCGKCVLNDNHDLCVLHYINVVNNRTKQPIAIPISAKEPKRTMNQSVATSLKKIVASESTNKNPRKSFRKLHEHVSKTCNWWYTKISPPGYQWKPKSSALNVKPNVSLPLGNKSRNANTLESNTIRGSILSNSPLSSNSFAAHRDNTVHLRIWVLKAHDGKSQASKVYYVEGLNHNLFSVGQFCDADLEVAFQKSTCYIRDLKGNDLLTGSRGTDLYSITLQDTSTPNPICLMAKASSSQAWLWHRRLSHLNFDTINFLSKNDIVIGLPKLKFIKDHLCSSCELGKAKRKSFQTKTTPSSKRRLEILHMDLCGPMRVESFNGKKYILVIVDDYSIYTWTHFLRSKDETPQVLIDFLKPVQRGLHAQVRTVRTDKGTEFLNKTLHQYFAQEGIEHQTSTARTPEQNGVVERRNRTLVEAARIMLSAAKVPLDGENLDKMKEKGDACIFVGYSTQSRAYRVYNKRTRVIVETIHVNFDELPQMASDQVSYDPVPQYLLFSSMFDDFLNGSSPVVSKSSVVTVVDARDKRQQQNTTPSTSTTVVAESPPLNIPTTHVPASQTPIQAPTVTPTENIHQAESQVENV
ncbi:retrovirus-related pol polyprotein from transposon TNT 1-94 [Tanacetum coccineum]